MEALVQQLMQSVRQPTLALTMVCGAVLSACSVSNLSFAELERDLDAMVRIDSDGTTEQLSYADEALQSRWWARSWVLKPIKPILNLLVLQVGLETFENPSGQIRELVSSLADKAGADIEASAAAALRMGYVAYLDPSALNRAVALDGMATLARHHDFPLLAGLERTGPLPPASVDVGALMQRFSALWPKGREPFCSPLDTAAAERYRQTLEDFVAQPLRDWRLRLRLITSLREALAFEPDPSMRQFTRAQLLKAVQHTVQWTLIDSLRGQDPLWSEVRIRSLEILHRDGGPDSVPLLLALMENNRQSVASGEPRFDPDHMMQLRLIHICGQLDRDRAERSVVLPGREDWPRVAPVDFLTDIILAPNAMLSPLALPARNALAHCLGRRSLTESSDGTDWVRDWFDEYRKRT
jgi:hypothetical protein